MLCLFLTNEGSPGDIAEDVNPAIVGRAQQDIIKGEATS